MTDPDGRRRRPAVSCTLCRKRKIRCNRQKPCSNCLRARNGSCVYGTPQSQPDSSPASEQIPIEAASSTSRSTIPSHPSSLVGPSSVSTPMSQASAQETELMRMKLKVQQLEEQLAKQAAPVQLSLLTQDSSNIETTSSSLGGTFHVHTERDSFGQPQAIARSVAYKTRLLGQSHWAVNGILLIRDILEITDASDAWAGIERCKSLARVIKARRAPPWPSVPTPDVPVKEVADTLVDHYLRTSESVYRILHVPTFRRDYEALWMDATPNTTFLVLLKLVLAIGATTYDQQFSLRGAAIRWVYEAQTWVSEPKFKSRLDLQSLQISLLLLMAQERLGVGELIWISVGALLRKAIHMGLHRDPVHIPQGRATLIAEMRRRLWNTILELSLLSSLASGGPPLISLSDFDTASPSNFTDEQLTSGNPIPAPSDQFTPVSVAIALRTTFPTRLAIVKHLNDLSPQNTYKDTLRLDADLRIAYKALTQALHPTTPSTPFSIHALDFLIQRYLLSLHAPYFGPSLHEATYAFSRKVVIDSSFKIWRTACPCPSPPSTSPSNDSDIPRLATTTSGFYPTTTIQSTFLIALELRAQLQEDSLGPVLLRPDLLAMVDEAPEWCLRVIEAGETNVKGYLLTRIMGAQIEGLKSGKGREEISSMLTKAVEDVERVCMPMLKRMVEEMGEVASETPGGMEWDWGDMSADDHFDPSSAESMSWIFNEDVILGW
ncbi:uncharacterized protein BO80DRAFT_460985 [Aspergillus ibericus CBS 121593]|uniref:Zn(2)-C6 fungal-type domain-containing protein n=1 Tax=Aspergillus ibericus CBS 121593 TaxID=1448316 RepID=A0A395HER4_9EURO|nr:hypothetical protein BO80DRAFT_460985 [Aspergillus ibericus CBS 121593]RAL05943.1 hypothetical protein BO80DRAFT_460985 [Aspergillus ibericus CBS 121593]